MRVFGRVVHGWTAAKEARPRRFVLIEVEDDDWPARSGQRVAMFEVAEEVVEVLAPNDQPAQ